MTEELGFENKPDRYDVNGREAVDLIRDDMNRDEFISFCRATAKLYRLRDGKKEGTTPEEDAAKAVWWSMMASHAEGKGPDPRSTRAEFEPWRRQGLPLPIERHRIDVLDHGFVRLIETWGQGETRVPEAGIIEAARQSTQGNFRGWKKDRQLLRYLHEHKHGTPFEFGGMVLEIRAPLFVFREWHRHRTQSYNEMSARYAPLPDLNYVPSLKRLMGGAEGTENKQAGPVRGSDLLTIENAIGFQNRLKRSYALFETAYQDALNDGVPKELARCGMPIGRYSQMRASAVLRNWLAFLTLRMDPAAQWEIRQYANAVCEIVGEEFPQTAALFAESRAA